MKTLSVLISSLIFLWSSCTFLMDLSTSNDLTTSSLLVAVSAQEVETITEEVTTQVEDDETLDLDDEEETKEVENNESDEDEDEEIVDVENTNDEEVEEATEDEEEADIEETADTAEEDEEDTAETSAEEETTEETTGTDAEAADTQEESSDDDNTVMEEEEQEVIDAPEPPQQTGPLVDIFGETLLSLVMIDNKNAQLEVHNTNDALKGKKVIGVYFSADWCKCSLHIIYEHTNKKNLNSTCVLLHIFLMLTPASLTFSFLFPYCIGGPCRQFTPELVNFYNKMNARRGKQNQFEIVWVSRCRDMNSFGKRTKINLFSLFYTSRVYVCSIRYGLIFLNVIVFKLLLLHL